MSNPRRHFSRCPTSSGTCARARRKPTSTAASAEAGSHEAGINNRQPTGHDATSPTRFTLTPIWQFVTLPAVPVHYRATPGDAVPHLSQPVSSTAHTAGVIASSIRDASRRHTGTTPHGLFVTTWFNA